MPPHKDHFSACIIGQALGDAIGFNVQGHGPDVANRYVDGILHKGRAANYGRDPYQFGQYTDDTQLARELAISLVESDDFDASDYAHRIVTQFKKELLISESPSTRQSVKRLMEGISWKNAGDPAPNADNGSVARAAPLGLFYWDDTMGMLTAAHTQSRITHQDGRCSAAATVTAGAVALATEADGEPLDVNRFIAQLAEWSLTHSMLLAEGLQKLGNQWLKREPDHALPAISRYGITEEKQVDGIPNDALISVLWGLYAFLRSPKEYLEAVGTALRGGGEATITAAIAGAISGAYNGMEGLPQELATRINDQNGWGYTQLVALGEDLHQKAVDVRE